MQDFIQAIADEHVYLFDGAMGTMLYSKGVFINKCYDELNLRSPEIVLEVHKQYVRAGAEILETNTYGANRVKLTGFGLAEELREINMAGAALARKAAGDSRYVAGAIGPLGIRIEPYGPTSLDEAREIFREQATALRDGGVDLFVLETMSNIAEMEQAIAAVRDVCTLPIIAQMTIGTDGRTIYGDTPRVIAQRLDRGGRRRHRPQLLRRSRRHARRDRGDQRGHREEDLLSAERRPAARRQPAGRCTWPRPTTWPSTRSGSSTKA